MKIGVILGSTRKIRRGERVAKWIMSQVPKFEKATFELLDLRDYPLPFYAEDSSPDSLENGYTNDVAKKWAAKIGEMDGFIFIVGEYNHGPLAVLKNALDYVYTQWNKKPVAFVSYATGASGGMRAVEQLRPIVGELEMADMQAAVHIKNVLDTLDENGAQLLGHSDKQLDKVMQQFFWWAEALKTAREKSTEK
ncbi:MAG: NADPH-dependent FMN reductase [Candidatus Levyibacteriota bacterium]